MRNSRPRRSVKRRTGKTRDAPVATWRGVVPPCPRAPVPAEPGGGAFGRDASQRKSRRAAAAKVHAVTLKRFLGRKTKWQRSY